MTGTVRAVHLSDVHEFSKQTVGEIELIEGIGVQGDAHSGVTVQHRSRVMRNPATPNLRQVHLIHDELFDELRGQGHVVEPGQLGENITTHGIDLLGLPVGARLVIGDAEIVVTGLRNPCKQIERFQEGLLGQLVHTDDDGKTVRLAGVMGQVARGGTVRAGDAIEVILPPGRHYYLAPV